VESRILAELWREMARTYADIKFCEMRADLCIEGYPERNTPTILVYRDSDIQRQIVTLAELNGPRTGIADLERLLLDLGAIKENDVCLKRKDSEEDMSHQRRRQAAVEEDDDDWD
jgi:hypothetical protein